MTDIVTTSRKAPNEDLKILIGRMDGKLDIVTGMIIDHGHRISALEAWKNRAIGWVLAAAFAGGATSDRIISIFLDK